MEDFMIFDFSKYINALRQDDANKALVEESEKCFGNQDGKGIEDQPFYKQYLSRIKIPAGMIDGMARLLDSNMSNDDCDLFLRFVACSFPSDYLLKIDKDTGEVRLWIAVKCKSKSVEKKLDELWVSQIDRLFRIYLHVQMSLAVIFESDPEERKAVSQNREMLLNLFSEQVSKVQNLIEVADDYKQFDKEYERLVS